MKLKELRHSHLRSLFSQKSPFCPFFGPFYPDFAHKSALRAEAATHRLAPGKPGWPPTSTSPLFSRPTPHTPRRQASGFRSCADPPPLATACHRPPNCQRPNGTRSRRAVPLCQYVTEIQYVTEPGNFFGQIHLFLPARRRPTVDHSLTAGGAQREGSGKGERTGPPTLWYLGNVDGPQCHTSLHATRTSD